MKVKKEIKIIKATQEEIDKWEAENRNKYTGWEKDYEKCTITFFFKDSPAVCFEILTAPEGDKTKEGE